jgi:hypothetical protein
MYADQWIALGVMVITRGNHDAKYIHYAFFSEATYAANITNDRK